MEVDDPNDIIHSIPGSDVKIIEYSIHFVKMGKVKSNDPPKNARSIIIWLSALLLHIVSPIILVLISIKRVIFSLGIMRDFTSYKNQRRKIAFYSFFIYIFALLIAATYGIRIIYHLCDYVSCWRENPIFYLSLATARGSGLLVSGLFALLVFVVLGPVSSHFEVPPTIFTIE